MAQLSEPPSKIWSYTDLVLDIKYVLLYCILSICRVIPYSSTKEPSSSRRETMYGQMNMYYNRVTTQLKDAVPVLSTCPSVLPRLVLPGFIFHLNQLTLRVRTLEYSFGVFLGVGRDCTVVLVPTMLVSVHLLCTRLWSVCVHSSASCHHNCSCPPSARACAWSK